MKPIKVVTFATVLVLSLGCSGNNNKPANNKKEVSDKDLGMPELSDAQKKGVMKRCAQLKAEDEVSKGRKHTLAEEKAWVKDCEAIFDAERLAKSQEEDRSVLGRMKALNRDLKEITGDLEKSLDNVEKTLGDSVQETKRRLKLPAPPSPPTGQN